MERYDEHVNTVMQFLASRNYGTTAIYVHRYCYDRLKEWLIASGVSYSPEALHSCFESHRSQLSQMKRWEYEHSIDQLIDVYETGRIRDKHLGYQVCPYDQLGTTLRQETDEFLSYCVTEGKDANYVKSLRGSCSAFMLFLQNQGISSISRITFDLIILFQRQEIPFTPKTRLANIRVARTMLRYFADHGKCLRGHEKAMNVLTYDEVVMVTDFIPADAKQPMDHCLWETAGAFRIAMKESRYGRSRAALAYHCASMLLVFLEKNDLALSRGIADLWFERYRLICKSNWKQHRRFLNQFLHFVEKGEIITDATTPRKIRITDGIPGWCKTEWEAFLSILRRENRAQSTIAMYRSSVYRFCMYLDEIGVTGFEHLTPEILIGFNAHDKHKTAEGKAAYNSRIRKFIFYLEDKGIVANLWLHAAVPTIYAPRTKIIDTLTDKAVDAFWRINQEDLTPIQRRDYAISCLGLGMGIRSVDIVSIGMDDIDWDKPQISFVQKKTGCHVVLPMPVHVGNAIFRYLQVRPQSTSSCIFISHRVPYESISRCICSRALRRFIGDIEPTASFHITRRTFATALLRGQTKTSVISDSLGHRSDNAVFRYLSLDEQRTRQCALSMVQLGISWPEGGAFHG